MESSDKRVVILQTGRLGDLWFTTPLAYHFYRQGMDVDVVYNRKFGNPFSFFPYINPKPFECREYFAGDRWGYALNEAVWQMRAYAALKRQGSPVVWNQLFPYRWHWAMNRSVSWTELWYRKYPEVKLKDIGTTLKISNNRTILVFQESQSIRFVKDQSYYDWIFANLKQVEAATGYRPIVVAYGDQPDHPEYETWRGSLDDYQRLVAGCGLVFGIVTSAHILGALLGKPTVALYNQSQCTLDIIGKLATVSVLRPEVVDLGQLDLQGGMYER